MIGKLYNLIVSLLVGILNWVDARLPIMKAWRTHMSEYYAPKNFNIWFVFGFLSMVVLVNQILTGIWLTMNFTPTAEGAFASVEYIMRDVKGGDILRYLHSTGASAFFIVIYLHMFRALLYGSYKKPRELVWILGMTIYLALMAEGFLGYILPWGQMSYWGANVIVSLFSAIPYVGGMLQEFIQGDYLISGITLNRFFALHVIAVPLALVVLVFLHIVALHEVGSNNPDGIEIKENKDANGIPLDGIAFHPYYTVHDLWGLAVFLFVFCFVVFFMPEMGGYFLEHPNFETANALKTPEHIAPTWYFTPFYSILRAIPNKLGGFIAMGAAIAVLFVLPWLDRSPVKSIRYKGIFSRVAIILFLVSFIILGVLGTKGPTEARGLLALICTIVYFAYFLLMPIWTSFEKTKPVPERVTMNGGLSRLKVLGVIIVLGLLVVLPLKVVGSEGYDCGSIACEEFKPSFEDQASLQRGAKLFMNNCYACHSLKYSRYERVASDIGIPNDLMEEHLIFDDSKIGALMDNKADKKVMSSWFGVAPLDLTLVTRARSPEWVYTYLKSFYADSSRPWGVNNLVFKDVGMPHVLLPLQGTPVCVEDSHALEGHKACQIKIIKAGLMNEAEFDKAIYDMTNFLTYVSDPNLSNRHRIGLYVLFFILLFGLMTFLLNREYWKGIH